MKYIRSKWRNWRIIHLQKKLSHCQPLTMIYSLRSLQVFMKRFHTVFIKPDNSFGGKNVIRVQRKGAYYYALGNNLRRFNQVKSLHRWLQSIQKRKVWIIQQAVELKPLHGRPVDIRTIIQKNKLNQWEVTGIFAKAAKKGAAVTNVKAGGSAIRVDRYLKWIGYKGLQRKVLVKKYKVLSIQIARELNRYFPNRLYALDLGMDNKRRVWLIEVNTKPSIHILKKIDMRMFHRTIQVGRGK